MKTQFARFLILLSIVFQAHSNDITNKLQQLKEWQNQGLITNQEYQQKKDLILNNFSQQNRPQANQLQQRSYNRNIPVENLIAVIPFFGKVYSDGDRDTIAKFTAKNAANYIAKKNYNFNHGILDFHKAKGYLLEDLRLIDPDENYTNDFLAKVANTLKVRYIFFGNIHHYSFDKQVYRFNVECMVYDSTQNKVIFNRRARQSSRRKFFDAYIAKEKGKTIGKISEQFYFFIDQIASNNSMKEHPFESANSYR